MKKIAVLLALSFLLLTAYKPFKTLFLSAQNKSVYGLVIHGGAGYIKNLPPEKEKKYREKLNEALEAGYVVLEKGGKAEDAVVAAITILEDSPLFNAGKGSVLNHLGQVEMDASIMRGYDLNAGAVAGVHHVKNPILAAKAVMEKSKHVMLSCGGADQYAKEMGLDVMPQEYFILPRRTEQLKKIQEKNNKNTENSSLKKHGTVGCVALDKQGNIAAGTSTGGLMNKKFGRIGDSPIIGAGTYANNSTSGISCTGTGEYFIRTLAAHTVSDLMEFQKADLQTAMKKALEKVENLGGDGGMIGMDKNGKVFWIFNTEGMFRAMKTSSGEKKIQMYK